MAITAAGAAAPAQRTQTAEQAKTGALPAGPGSAFFRDEAPAGQRLPRLKDALADPAFEPVGAMAVPVPDEVLAALRGAKKAMVIGHTATDGDAVGSVLGLTRALRLLGKEVDPVIDDELPGQLRSIPGSNQIQRFGDREAGADYDLVVMVDVAQAARIGKAAEAVAKAPRVLVIDHHQTEPTKASLGMKDEATLTTWVEKSADAASLLIAGVTDHLLDGVEVTKADAQSVAGPELAGMLTDSGGFRYAGVDRVSMAVFKYELGEKFEGGLTALQQTIQYDLPMLGQELLSTPPDLTGLEAAGGETAQALFARAQQAVKDGLTPHVEELPNGGRALVVPEVFFELAFEAARISDPQVVKPDIVGQLKRDLARTMDDAHPWAALVFGEDGKTYVSARSKEAGPAVSLAEALGGGGHDRAAGAAVDAGVDDVMTRVRTWAAAQGK